MKNIFMRWFTNPTYSSLCRRIDITLDYLEKVSERKEVEETLMKDLEKLENWTYDNAVRKETVLEFKERYKTIKEKRLP